MLPLSVSPLLTICVAWSSGFLLIDGIRSITSIEDKKERELVGGGNDSAMPGAALRLAA